MLDQLGVVTALDLKECSQQHLSALAALLKPSKKTKKLLGAMGIVVYAPSSSVPGPTSVAVEVESSSVRAHSIVALQTHKADSRVSIEQQQQQQQQQQQMDSSNSSRIISVNAQDDMLNENWKQLWDLIRNPTSLAPGGDAKGSMQTLLDQLGIVTALDLKECSPQHLSALAALLKPDKKTKKLLGAMGIVVYAPSSSVPGPTSVAVEVESSSLRAH